MLALGAVAPTAAKGASLPQDHAYQKELRKFLATLKESDFVVPDAPFTLAPAERSAEEQFRAYLLSVNIPPFHGVRQPASQFTLSFIEGEQAVMQPPVYIDALAWLASWNDPGNPYYRSRPVKLRAFVAACVDMMMHDRLNETQPGLRTSKSDCLGGTLIWLAQAYAVARDELPVEACSAYETGLKKLARRIDHWGPTGAMVDMDLFAAVSMRAVADLVNDPEITAMAKNYVNRLFTDPRYFHPAGYFVDNDCFDTSYNGISLYFAAWAALQAPDWPAARQATDQAFKLKSRLSFPDPDGQLFGPTQCSSRTTSDSPQDQWNFPTRNLGAAMLSDHAIFLNPMPSPQTLAAAPRKLTNDLNELLAFAKPAPARAWEEDHWIASGAVNFTYDYYVKGHYEKLVRLEAEKSPLFKPPFSRGETFIEIYDKAFVVARFADFGLAIHTGPVGGGMLGFGGGQLCGFWTPQAGTVILGRRRGLAAQVKGHVASVDRNLSSLPDTYEAWRIWPIHAVTGVTAGGNVFTSARIRDCQPVYTLKDQLIEVRVGGLIPKDPTNNGPPLRGDVKYNRKFIADSSGVSIETSVTLDGQDAIAELYETLPVYLRDARLQSKQKPSVISFQTEAGWIEAGATLQSGVRAIKVQRFEGSALLTFSKPARVKLSPEDWSDLYQSAASCRTILIDLLQNGDQPLAKKGVNTVQYRITPERR